MIQQVATFNSSLPQQQRITVSVEIEKTREPLYRLFPHGDVVRLQQQQQQLCQCQLFILRIHTLTSCFTLRVQVFVSKDVARHFGFVTAEEALRGLYSRVKEG